MNEQILKEYIVNLCPDSTWQGETSLDDSLEKASNIVLGLFLLLRYFCKWDMVIFIISGVVQESALGQGQIRT